MNEMVEVEKDYLEALLDIKKQHRVIQKKYLELLKSYEPDFNFDYDHWEDGNFDDSFQYGQECGEQFILGKLKKML